MSLSILSLRRHRLKYKPVYVPFVIMQRSLPTWRSPMTTAVFTPIISSLHKSVLGESAVHGAGCIIQTLRTGLNETLPFRNVRGNRQPIILEWMCELDLHSLNCKGQQRRSHKNYGCASEKKLSGPNCGCRWAMGVRKGGLSQNASAVFLLA
jgi:hypothetical protein